MNRRAAFFYLLLILGAGTAFWWITDDTGRDEKITRKAGTFPSSYAEQLTVTEYDMDGIPIYKLQTPSMRSYEETDTTELDNPNMWRYTPGQAPWRLSGERAVVENEGERVFLPGPVFIDRDALGDAPPYQITTSNLHLVSATSYAETDQAIRIESRDHWITAVGMQGWLREPLRIRLLNQVRGQYESL